ncbi:hypothetical protein EMIT079MI2_80118 [Bacillus sp. IT-79MI2]
MKAINMDGLFWSKQHMTYHGTVKIYENASNWRNWFSGTKTCFSISEYGL